MKLESAREAIRAILAAIPNEELPKPDKTEEYDGKTVAWFSGHGYTLGSARKRMTGGKWERSPEIYRDDAVREAIEHEAAYRIDLKHLEGETK